MARGHYDGDEDARAWRQLSADTHLLLVAAGQLELSLRHFDGDLRLPEGLTRRHLRALRDVFEHWDKRGNRAQKVVAKLTEDPTSNEWRADGSGRIGQIVYDDVVRRWAGSVYAELLHFDSPIGADG